MLIQAFTYIMYETSSMGSTEGLKELDGLISRQGGLGSFCMECAYTNLQSCLNTVHWCFSFCIIK